MSLQKRCPPLLNRLESRSNENCSVGYLVEEGHGFWKEKMEFRRKFVVLEAEILNLLRQKPGQIKLRSLHG